MYTSEDGNLAYLLHLPSGYNHAGNDRWPLLVFLHGWGESGDDLQLLKYHWVPKHLDTAASIPFVVVAPQAPEGVEWQELTELLLAFIRAATLKYRVNPDQICLNRSEHWRQGRLGPGREASGNVCCRGAGLRRHTGSGGIHGQRPKPPQGAGMGSSRRPG